MDNLLRLFFVWLKVDPEQSFTDGDGIAGLNGGRLGNFGPIQEGAIFAFQILNPDSSIRFVRFGMKPGYSRIGREVQIDRHFFIRAANSNESLCGGQYPPVTGVTNANLHRN